VSGRSRALESNTTVSSHLYLAGIETLPHRSFGGGAESAIAEENEEVPMEDEHVAAAVYLEVVNEMPVQLNRLRDLMNDPTWRLTGSDAKYLVGGQITYLAEILL
jgi:hypothetical protein